MTRRNGTIEFLRFVFAVVILVFHGKFVPHPFKFGGGYLGVEFFFIISGIFMAQKLRKADDTTKITDILRESRQNIIRRICAVLPYLIVSSIIATVFIGIVMEWSFFGACFNSILLISDFLMLQNYGCTSVSATGVVWYLCAMLFAYWILYPILRKYYKVYVYYIAPVIVLASVGFLLHNYGKLNCPHTFYGLINTGLVRAVSMMSLGCIVTELAEKVKTIPFTQFGKLSIKLVQIVSLLSCLAYIVMWRENIAVFDHLWLLSMVAFLVCVMSGNDIFYKIFDNKFSLFLGKFSITIYLNHYYWFSNMSGFLRNIGLDLWLPYEKSIAVCMSFVSSFVVWFIVKAYYKSESKIKSLFVECD